MTSRIRSGKVTIGGAGIHYFTGGQGDPLLIIHGGSNGASAWKKNIEELAESYTIYMPDMPGFGRSQLIEGNCYRMPEMVDFVDSFARELGLKQFHLLGHSFGGGIALSYALRFPGNVTKLVLVSSLFLGKEIAGWVSFLTRRAICQPLGWAAVNLFRAVRWLAGRLFASIDYVVPVSLASVYIGGSIKEHTEMLADRLSEIVMPTPCWSGGLKTRSCPSGRLTLRQS